MESIELIILIIILFFTSILAYKSSFLQHRKIGYISLLQILYLVLLPGLAYTIIFSYILSLLQRPLNNYVLLKDSLLVNMFLISSLYTYGGIAIHSVCKTMSSFYRPKQQSSLVCQVNKYFHLDFSHNLVFAGLLVSLVSFAILEINHLPSYQDSLGSLMLIVIGIVSGLAAAGCLTFLYQKKSWLELKFFFIIFWLATIVLIIASRPYLKNIYFFPITLITLTAFAILGSLNIFLIIRGLKNKLSC